MDITALIPNFANLAFYLFAALAIVFGVSVAFGRNIIYSAFSLLGCFVGVAGLYVLLVADFVGALQVFVYVGGITVLIVFAVMFTRGIGDVEISNQSMNWRSGVAAVGVMFSLLLMVILDTPWRLIEVRSDEPTTQAIGDLLLSKYLFPFELISLVLLVALIGAIVIARKDIRGDEADSGGGEPS
jgi:NADH:ubiquinone oxidoreductase subunit 6 (subunit J)